jgi:hypothetical protein
MHHDVKGYATDISIQSLLEGTNAQRTANSQSNLTLNAKLDQAAQNKANDMAARNYWSHNTPDGQTPWSFITAVGYSYQKAGENLAYGFASSSDTITGWMNSPEHRANILNASYQEVGFGIINIPDYQNSGPQTLVVAMYAQPDSQAVAAAQPSQSSPTAASRTGSAPEVSKPAPTPVEPTAAPTPVATAAPTTRDNTRKNDTVMAAKMQDTVSEQRVARVQLFTAGNASWSLFAATALGAAALLIFILRHGLAWHRVLVRGERFVLHHPLLDIAIVGLGAIGFILSQTSGLVR